MPAATYTFLPWLRRGVSNLLPTSGGATATSIRASMSAVLTVASEARQADTPPLTMQLIGPADITGIETRQVIRTEPRAGTTDFESNYLAAIDFYDEDFPWRYTPLPQDSVTHRLPPWLVLVALKESEFTRGAGAIDVPPFITLTGSAHREDLFPVLGQEWAWAHVHVNHAVAGAGTVPDLAQLRALLESDPDLAYSRLLCPRQLEPNCTYFAFLLPAFETGRKAGLGDTVPETENGLTRSWEGSANEFPVYYEWSFRTGNGGDFETLVRNMVPRDMDPAVGIRDLDIRTPGFGAGEITNPPDDQVGLEGALLAPTTVRRGLASTSNFVPRVQPILNAPAEAQSQGNVDPVVAPPIYGCWHARVQRVNTPGEDATWVNELNLDPRYRAVAGLGVRVIRARQEEYMRIAWAQVGDILAVNRRIRRAQLAVQAASAAFSKSLKTLPAERALALISPALSKVRGQLGTLATALRASTAPRAAFSAAMAKQLRPRGRVARLFFSPEIRTSALATTMSRLSQGSLSAAPERLPAGGPTLEGLNRAVLQMQPPSFGFTVAPPAIGAALMREVVNLLSGRGLEPAAVAGAEAQPRLRFSGSPADHVLPAAARAPRPAFQAADSPEAADLRTALTAFHDVLSKHVQPTAGKPPLNVGALHQQAMLALEPRTAFVNRFAPLLRMGAQDVLAYAQDRYASNSTADATLPEVMAYPDIKDPAYRPLVEISGEYLLPNLKLIPPNTISLLKPNQAFIESYLVGLNHEFARELLWQEFPTDQQGSYFRQFWDVSSFVDRDGLDPQTLAESLKDIPEIHRWNASSQLGAHNHRAPQDPPDKPSQTVLVLRGDLLLRYPNTFIYMQKATWGTGTQANRLVLTDPTGELFESSPLDPRLRFPLYKATVPPDIYLLGFDLGLDVIRGDPRLEETAVARAAVGDNTGWFFVLQQVVGEPRFGLDTQPPIEPSPLVWDNLSWANLDVGAGGIVDVAKPFVAPPNGSNLGGLAWGSNAADTAAILYQQPSMVAIHGRTMLKNLSLAP